MDKPYEGFKYDEGRFVKVSDQIVNEKPLTILINKEPFTVTMCSKSEEEFLGFGLLYCEGFLDEYSSDILDVALDENGEISELNFELSIDSKEFTNKRNLLSVSSCGICGQTELKKPSGHVLDSIQYSADDLFSMMKLMKDQQGNFDSTGGSHAAAIFDQEKNLLACSEDVGRHNAVDKAIGKVLKGNKIKDSKALLVSGRISYEILVKCFKAKIPVLIAVSTPSSLSIDFAKELGITIVGFTRQNKFTVYSNPDRLKGID